MPLARLDAGSSNGSSNLNLAQVHATSRMSFSDEEGLEDVEDFVQEVCAYPPAASAFPRPVLCRGAVPSLPPVLPLLGCALAAANQRGPMSPPTPSS